MRVLVVSSWAAEPADNGARKRARTILLHLSARHDVHLVSFAEAGGEDALRRWGRQFASCAVFTGNPHKATHRLRMRDLWSSVPRSYRASFDDAVQDAVRSRLPLMDAGIALQVGTAAYLAPVESLPRVFEEAELATIHEARRNAASIPARCRRELTWRKYARYHARLTRQFDMTTVVSEPERELLSRAGARRDAVMVVPNGVEEGLFEVPHAPAPARFVYTGSITYEANRDAVRWFVHEVWPAVRVRLPDATFLVSGETGAQDVADLLAPGVSFTGRVADVAPLLAGATALVVPLRVGGGTRLKVLEAFAIGTPVVSTVKGVQGLAVAPGIHAAVAGDAGTFADAVVACQRVPGEAAARAARARRDIAEPHRWSNTLGALDAAIERAVVRWTRRRGRR